MHDGHPHTTHRFLPLVLALGLIAGGTTALTACTADQRPSAIETAITAALDKEPYLLGVKVGDVAMAVKAAGSKATTVQVPVMIPDLIATGAGMAVQQDVAAQPEAQATYDTPAAAAAAMGELGQRSWQAWLDAHPGDITYKTITIPVTIAQAKNAPVTATVDQDQLHAKLNPIAQTDLRLILAPVMMQPAWQKTLIPAAVPAIAGDVTGLPDSALSRVTLAGAERLSDSALTITLSYPDPAAVVAYQVDQVVRDHGTAKIFDGWTRDDIQAKAEQYTDIPDTIGTPVTGQAVVEISSSSAAYAITESLAQNLTRAADATDVTLQEGSYTVPDTSAAWSSALDKAMEELTPYFVLEQPRPATGLLLAGQSGQRLTATNGYSHDIHMTFFTWGTTTPVVSAFITAEGSLSLRVPTGTYRMVYGSGDTWYGTDYSFGPKGSYQEFKEDPTSDGPMKIVIQGGYTYTLSLAVSANDDTNSVPTGGTDNPYQT